MPSLARYAMRIVIPVECTVIPANATVIPANAGIAFHDLLPYSKDWIPAFAGMTAFGLISLHV
jgi:hypothetical protein